DLPNDVHEFIGLDDIDPWPADIGALDAKDIGVEGTPDDGVGDKAVPDEPGRRKRGYGRIPRQERPGVGSRKDAGEVTGKGCAKRRIRLGSCPERREAPRDSESPAAPDFLLLLP